MNHWFASLLPVLIPSACGMVAAWIHAYIVAPRHQERVARAELLAKIANDAAAYVLLNNPRSVPAAMLADVVSRINGAAGLPTTDSGAIQRAAAGALARHPASTMANAIQAGAAVASAISPPKA